MQRLITGLVVSVVLALMGFTAYATPILSVVDGQLVGATGVSVGEKLYDVEFRDGTCVALFNGCDDPDDFTFTTATDARLASTALLTQVLLGGFDSNSALTSGITNSSYAFIYTPYENVTEGSDNSVYVSGALNSLLESGDDSSQFFIASITYDTTQSTSETFAIWSPSQVPEPATITLLGVGLLGIGFSRRRQFRKSGSFQ